MNYENEYKRQFERLTKYISEEIQDPNFYTANGLYDKIRKINFLLNIKEELKSIKKLDKAFVNEFEEMYKVNVENVIKTFSEAGIDIKLRKEFTKVDLTEIDRLKQSFLNDIRKAEDKYYRQLETFISKVERNNKKIIAESTKEQLENIVIGGDSRYVAMKNLVTDLNSKGITTFLFLTEAGKVRNIGLDDYAKMLLRTKSAELNVLATVNSCDRLGHDLVKWSSHSTHCEVCGTYAEGRVYSLKEGNKDYPYIKTIPNFAKGFNSIHPNCKHSLGVYFPNLDNNAYKVKQLSNNLTDTRSNAKIKRYDSQQSINRYKRLLRKSLAQSKGINALGDKITDSDRKKLDRLKESRKLYRSRINELRT